MIIQAVLHFNVYIIVSPLPLPTRPTPLNKDLLCLCLNNVQSMNNIHNKYSNYPHLPHVFRHVHMSYLDDDPEQVEAQLVQNLYLDQRQTLAELCPHYFCW